MLKGTHCRVKLDETIEDAYAKILEKTQLSNSFELFEVCQDTRNRYCRILRCFSTLKDVKRKINDKELPDDGTALTLNEINESVPESVTHESTWLLLKNTGEGEENYELCQQLKELAGYTIVPMRLKVRLFEDETELVVYNILSLFLLLQKISDMTQIPTDQFRVKAIDEARIFRIDNKAKNDEIKATISMRDLEIHDGTPLIVELKQDGDEEADA